MKIQNALVSNILDRSQRFFAHVTVTLSWRVQNIVVIGRVYFPLECFEFSSNFEFDRNMLSGTGTRTGKNLCITIFNSLWPGFVIVTPYGNTDLGRHWFSYYLGSLMKTKAVRSWRRRLGISTNLQNAPIHQRNWLMRSDPCTIDANTIAASLAGQTDQLF